MIPQVIRGRAQRCRGETIEPEIISTAGGVSTVNDYLTAPIEEDFKGFAFAVSLLGSGDAFALELNGSIGLLRQL